MIRIIYFILYYGINTIIAHFIPVLKAFVISQCERCQVYIYDMHCKLPSCILLSVFWFKKKHLFLSWQSDFINFTLFLPDVADFFLALIACSLFWKKKADCKHGIYIQMKIGIWLQACSFKSSWVKWSQHVCCWLCSTSAPGKIALLCFSPRSGPPGSRRRCRL